MWNDKYQIKRNNLRFIEAFLSVYLLKCHRIADIVTSPFDLNISQCAKVINNH